MNNLQQVVQRAKRDIELKYVYVMMPIPQLQTLLTGLEELQREVEEKDDAIAYAMNQIQIKTSHIYKIEEENHRLRNEIEEGAPLRFKMDANGNLTQMEDSP